MKSVEISLAILLTCCVATNSCSQTASARKSPKTYFFVGSTPCDSVIRSALKFPAGSVWDHVKWELSLSRDAPATFKVTAYYVGIDSNTNRYVETDIETTAEGKYTTQTGLQGSPNLKLFRLTSDSLQSSIFLVQLDSNILHFADANKKFLVGHAGFGYVLNRTQK